LENNKKIELFLPIGFICFAIYVIVIGFNLPGVEGYFPMMIGFLMLASSIAILIKTLKQPQPIIHIEKINISNIIKAVVALVIYVILLPRIGYLVSTFLLGVFIIHALGFREKKAMIFYPLIIVGILFICFKVLLGVPLPMALFNL
jgi:putative tricarboxylic transport membrane protein